MNTVQKNIAERALLVSVTSRKAQRTRKDNDETKALLAAHNADDDAAAVIGTLFPGDPRIKRIDQAFSAAKGYVDSVSFPYSNTRGLRIVPAERFFEVTNELNRHKDNIRSVVSDAAAEYQTMLDEAATKRNGMFTASDYPRTAEEFTDCFELRVTFLPFPDKRHILVQLGNEAVQEIAANVDAQIQEALGNVTTRLAKQLHVFLRRVVENLSKEKPTIRDSLLGNLKDFCASFDAMNLNDNAELRSLKLEVQVLADLDQKDIKENIEKRTEAARKAGDLLKKLSDYKLMG